jgi:hypothetical protein
MNYVWTESIKFQQNTLNLLTMGVRRSKKIKSEPIASKYRAT